jgi:formyltetrahydrofolate-dependent phosphoribosylglycinamide formyltransferase
MSVEPPSPIRLVFLLSGSGTTLQNLLDHIDDGHVDARVELVISSDPDAQGIVRAEKHGIPTEVVRPDAHETSDEFSRAISTHIDDVDPDLICMGGFMHFYTVPERYRFKVINIHPSLLPKHGGEGYYGRHVHEAVLDAGDQETGCSVHFVTNEGYDEGPVIKQKTVPVESGDTPETLEQRVKEKERELYPETVQLFAEGRVNVQNGTVTVDDPS